MGAGKGGGVGDSQVVKRPLNPFVTSQPLPSPPPPPTRTLPAANHPPTPSPPPPHPPTFQHTHHQSTNQPANRDRNFTLKLSLKSIGLSVIAERPVRREFMSLYIDGIDATMSQRTVTNSSYAFDSGGGSRSGSGSGLGLASGHGLGPSSGSALTSYQLEIADIQIDNYSETAVRPVLLHSFSSSRPVTVTVTFSPVLSYPGLSLPLILYP